MTYVIASSKFCCWSSSRDFSALHFPRNIICSPTKRKTEHTSSSSLPSSRRSNGADCGADDGVADDDDDDEDDDEGDDDGGLVASA